MDNIEFLYKEKILLEDDLNKKELSSIERVEIERNIFILEWVINKYIISEFNKILLDEKIEDKFNAISNNIMPYLKYSLDLYYLITYATFGSCRDYENRTEEKQIYTYIIYHTGLNRFKIWRSINIQQRIKSFALWKKEIDIIHIINKDIENTLHRKFKEKRLEWEWFNLTKEDIEYIKTL